MNSLKKATIQMNAIDCEKQKTMVEKEISIESIYRLTWMMYLESVFGRAMAEKDMQLPVLVVVCKGSTVAGYYQPKRNHRNAIVEINVAYYDGIDDANMEITIAHELAHHIAHCIWPNAKQWHGPEFRSVMAAIGFAGDTYHRMDSKKAKIVAAKVKSGNDLFEL